MNAADFHNWYEADDKGCWIWQRTASSGRGMQHFRGRMWNASRVAWTLLRGEIPEGAHVLHTCDVPMCVNPDHLYIGDHAQNMRDRDERGRNGHANKTHCKRGHEYTPENTYWNPSSGTNREGGRSCRACMTIWQREYRARRRAKAVAHQ